MKNLFVCLFLCVVLAACSSQPQKPSVKSSSKSSADYSFKNDGRDYNGVYQHQVYALDNMPDVHSIKQCDLQTAIQRQRAYLLKKSASHAKTVDGLTISASEQLRVLNQVEQWARNPAQPFPHMRAYKIAGKDNYGNVQFTGYFSPLMQVSRQRTQQFRYPIYGKPSKSMFTGKLPSRDEIDFQGALDGMGLEIAYADNLIDPFFMQIQGSGIVQFVDTGETATFAYDGKNGHRYYSIGRYLVEQGYMQPSEVSLDLIKDWLRSNPHQQRHVMSLNPSYVFFRKTQRLPTGASGQPVTAYCSIAVDPRYVPYGSTMVIKRPVLDATGNLIGHTNSLFFAQDRGGAIKGTGRVDIYTGVGHQAEQAASALKHYGSMWLLLPAY